MSESAAPAAPPPAPAAPAPAPAAPAPDIPQPATVQGPFNDAFADLDKMIQAAPEEPPKPPEDTAPPPPKPDAGKPPGDKPPEPPIEKLAPPALRKRYEELKAKLETIEKERAEIQADVEKREKTWGEKLTAHEKRIAENEKILQLVAYQKSEDYKSRWWEPFIDAYNTGRQSVAGIKVIGDDGNPRQGTPEDWDKYMRIVDDDEAAEFAERAFGNRRGMVEYHRQVTLEKNRLREKAIADHEKFAAESEKKTGEALQEQRKTIGKIWTESNEAAVKKYPQWFGPVDGDVEGNKLLERGMHMADRAFSSGQPLQEGDQPLDPKQKAQLDSAVRNKAGAFDRLVYFNRQLQKKLEAAEKKISEYESSEPGRGDGRRTQAPQPDNWEAQLEKMAKPRG